MSEPMHDRFMRMTTGQMLWVIVKLLCWVLESQQCQNWAIVDDVVTGFEQPSKECE